MNETRVRKLIVLMVNFNSVAFTADSIRSMRDQPVTEIHVLDNGSTIPQDPAFAALAEIDERVRLHRSDENLGFGGGVNRLVAETEGAPSDLLWILNPDTTVTGDAVAVLRAAAEEHPDAMLSPMILRPDGTIWYAGGSLDVRRGYSAHAHYNERPEVVGDQPFPTGFITGAAPVLSRATWDRVGPMREDLFLYWEDTEFSIRARGLGVPLLVVPQARIVHVEGGSSSGGHGRSDTYYYYFSRNRVLVCAPHAGLFSVVAGRGAVETARALLKPVLREPEGKWKKSVGSIRGLVDGVRQYLKDWRRG